MFDNWKREQKIRFTLRKLARQRVALILQPGNVWVIEQALNLSADQVGERLQTAYLRGWVEVAEHAVPAADLPQDMDTRKIQWDHVNPVYRLTQEGWNVIHNSHKWIVATFVAAVLSIMAGLSPIFYKVVGCQTVAPERQIVITVPMLAADQPSDRARSEQTKKGPSIPNKGPKAAQRR